LTSQMNCVILGESATIQIGTLYFFYFNLNSCWLSKIKERRF